MLHRATFDCPHVEFTKLSHQGGPYISNGKLHESGSFVTIWDGFPKFNIHCLIIPKSDILRELLSYTDIKLLLDMHTYSKWFVEEFKRMRGSIHLTVGIACNSAQVQLHAHVFSPTQPRPSLQRSQAKKFKYPAMRSIKDIIWYLLRKNAKNIPASELIVIYKCLNADSDMVEIS